MRAESVGATSPQSQNRDMAYMGMIVTEEGPVSRETLYER